MCNVLSDSDLPFMLLHLLDNCKKLGLVFENVVGIVEIINSKAVQLQVRAKSDSGFKPAVPGDRG